MKAHTASLINAVILVLFGLWGYFGSENPSFTALIPVAVGVVLLVLNRGVKVENKVVAHIAVLLTLLILIGLFKPLQGALVRGDTSAVVRTVTMIASTILAMIYFIRSFIEARKGKKKDA
jgi:hypothetical protein